MANKASRPASPLTFDLPVSLIGKIEMVQKRMGLASTSEVVRLAIAQFNFDRFEAEAEEHRQISVRLPVERRLKPGMQVQVHVDMSKASLFDAATEQRI